MIEETTSDLQELLQKNMDSEPDSPRISSTDLPPTESLNLEAAEERASIEACLAICAKVSEHIDEVQKDFVQTSNGERKNSRIVVVDKSTPAGQITSQRLEDCKTELGLTSDELRIRLKELDHRVVKLSRQAQHDTDSPAGNVDAVNISEEIESIRQCLSVCREATENVTKERINVFEDFNIVDDGDQVLVSTVGDLISAKRVKAGSRSMQVFGQMSDDSYQYTLNVIAARRVNGQTPQEKRDANDSKLEQASASRFSGQWGNGRKLK